MAHRLSDVNAILGFWDGCYADATLGTRWPPKGSPREYRWICGCEGVSFDGVTVQMTPCFDHQDDLFPVQTDGVPEKTRQAMLGVLDRAAARKRGRRERDQGKSGAAPDAGLPDSGSVES